jgi:hypothetical protein
MQKKSIFTIMSNGLMCGSLLFIAAIVINSCSKSSECELLMDKLFSSSSSEFTSGGLLILTAVIIFFQ